MTGSVASNDGIGSTVWKLSTAVLICLGASGTGAMAIDLVLKSQAGQSLEFNDNRDLSPKSKGSTYSSVTSLMFDALARTPTTKFASTVDLSYRAYTGSGAANVSDGIDHGVQASLEQRHRMTTYRVGGLWSSREASAVQLDDLGFITVKGRVNTYSAEGGLRQELNPQDTVGWHTRVTSVQFTGLQGTDFVDATTTANWVRRLDQLNTINSSLQLEWQRFDNVTNTELLVLRPTAGIQSRLTRQLTFQGTAGFNVVNTSVDTPSAPPPPGSVLPTSGTKLGWLLDVLLLYQQKMTEFSLAAGHNVAQSALGDLQERSSVALTAKQKISYASALSFSTTFAHIKAPGGTNALLIDQSVVKDNAVDVYTASLGYEHRFMRDWMARASYKFSHRKSDSGNANSNSVMVSVKHDMTIWRDQ